ncbi:hypothetical protein BDBG_17666 [Blastomyces gilchristii SLH14081]|uniref:Uncharacterized protein n=1 Tax=Blastomyces gilchristii (strain SLH14081) TaxID=559298 RepID=A0A179UZ25_BLAGS|nr:uncharacterized protein BDBG_17666 [Blastomyces gilchristii SLH14081]OAT12388.1 hypothetical protein BDBG_17666 [Blastomyces gilchristii SLH14081]
MKLVAKHTSVPLPEVIYSVINDCCGEIGMISLDPLIENLDCPGTPLCTDDDLRTGTCRRYLCFGGVRYKMSYQTCSLDHQGLSSHALTLPHETSWLITIIASPVSSTGNMPGGRSVEMDGSPCDPGIGYLDIVAARRVLF